MEQTFFQKLLKSPFALAGVIILFLMISYQLWGMTSRLLFFYGEKKQLEEKIVELEKKIEAVKTEINYTDSEGFLEREGKSRLNLKKPGEEVAVIVEEKVVPMEEEENNQGFFTRLLGSIGALFD